MNNYHTTEPEIKGIEYWGFQVVKINQFDRVDYIFLSKYSILIILCSVVQITILEFYLLLINKKGGERLFILRHKKHKL
jgi:hypothetical protein